MSNTKNRIHQLAIEDAAKIQTTIYTINDASEPDAFAYGVGVDATEQGQTVLGRYPDKNSMNNKLLVIGNGNEVIPSNAHTLDSNGNAEYSGTLTATNNIYINTKNGIQTVATKQDIIAPPEISLAILKEHGYIYLKAHGLDVNKTYTIKALTRSRHNGNHTGEWREIDSNYGYAMLAGTTRTKTKDGQTGITFPETPTWMLNNGKLQSIWSNIKYDEQYKCHLLIINPRIWLLDLLKPLFVSEGNMPSDMKDIEKKDYLFSGDKEPAAAMLIGLQSSGGYRGLPFKFRIYDENNQILAETNEIIYISGNINHKNSDILYKLRPASSIVYLHSITQQLQIDNIFLKIV